jgi:hypothetical protein
VDDDKEEDDEDDYEKDDTVDISLEKELQTCSASMYKNLQPA